MGKSPWALVEGGDLVRNFLCHFLGKWHKHLAGWRGACLLCLSIKVPVQLSYSAGGRAESCKCPSEEEETFSSPSKSLISPQWGEGLDRSGALDEGEMQSSELLCHLYSCTWRFTPYSKQQFQSMHFDLITLVWQPGIPLIYITPWRFKNSLMAQQ